MDANQFDAMVMRLGSEASRRRMLAALLGGALGVVGWAGGEAGTSRKCKPKCNECQFCRKGTCKKKNGKKTCKAGKCKKLTNGTACSGGGTCQSGICTAPTCTDGIKNGSESDIDCGGTCPRCADSRTCITRNDCAGALCVGVTCTACTNPGTRTGCGSDANGDCFCDTPATGGTNVCTTFPPTGDPVTACGECPSETICVAAGMLGFECFKRCGAP